MPAESPPPCAGREGIAGLTALLPSRVAMPHREMDFWKHQGTPKNSADMCIAQVGDEIAHDKIVAHSM